MKKFSVLICCVLLSMMAVGFAWSAEEQRKVTRQDIEVGDPDNTVASSGGHVGNKISNYAVIPPVVDVRDHGFAEGSSAAQNKAAILAAIASLPSDPGNLKGGKVSFPPGTFSVSPDIGPVRGNITFEGAATGYSYGMNDNNAFSTTMIFTGSGTYAFDLTNSNCNYTKISNMSIVGNANISYGIGFQGAQVLEDLTVSGFNLAGIIVSNGGNQSHISRVSSSYNIGTGLILDEAATSTTTMSIDKSNFRRNNVGIEIKSASHVTFNNVVVESNYALGLNIFKALTKNVNYVTFNNCWFEGNDNTAPGTGYQIKIYGENGASITDVPGDIVFNQCSMRAEDSHRNIHLLGVRYATFRDCAISGGDTSNSIVIDQNYASYVWFFDGDVVPPQSNVYGNRGGYFNRKTNGSTGFVTSGDVHTAGGRTMTIWFSSDSVTLSATTDNTLYLYPMIAANGPYRDTIRTYPVPNSGSIVGVVVSKRYAATTGTLTFTPYTQTDWNGSVSDLTTTASLPANTTHVEVTATVEADTWGDTSTTTNINHLGVRVNAPNPYTEGTNSNLIVGLIIEY